MLTTAESRPKAQVNLGRSNTNPLLGKAQQILASDLTLPRKTKDFFIGCGFACGMVEA